MGSRPLGKPPPSPHSSWPGHPRPCRLWPSARASSMGSEVKNEGVRGQRLGVSGHSAQALVSSIRVLVPFIKVGPAHLPKFLAHGPSHWE